MINTEPLGKERIKGLDVSEFQGKIDWQKVRRDGKEAVYIRSSLGDSYIDKEFENNYIGAKAAGLKIGFYHYVTAENTAQAREQARFFINTVKNKAFEMRLAMDFEYFGDLGYEEINNIAEAFLEETVLYSGKKAVIYSDASNAQNTWNVSISEKYPLWIADWDVRAPKYTDKWQGWVGWQYTDSGKINGITSEGTDLDLFTENIFLNNNKPIYSECKIDSVMSNDETEYKVLHGDTPKSISEKTGLKAAEIVGINNIKSPFDLGTGSILRIIKPTPYSSHLTP